MSIVNRLITYCCDECGIEATGERKPDGWHEYQDQHFCSDKCWNIWLHTDGNEMKTKRIIGGKWYVSSPYISEFLNENFSRIDHPSISEKRAQESGAMDTIMDMIEAGYAVEKDGRFYLLKSIKYTDIPF